jgi:hypothetical protein
VLSNPLRKQGNVSKIHAAPPAMLLQGTRHFSDDHVGTSIGIKAPPPPTTTLSSVQGSGHIPARHVSSKLHPHCTAGHLLVFIKEGVQGPMRRREKTGQGGEREGRTCNVRTHGCTAQTSGGRQSRRDAVEAASDGPPQGRTLSFSLSLASHSLSLSLSRNACNPYCKHP